MKLMVVYPTDSSNCDTPEKKEKANLHYFRKRRFFDGPGVAKRENVAKTSRKRKK